MDRHPIKRSVSRLARRLRAQNGFTLIEVLIAMGLGLIVMSAAMSFLIITLTQANQATSRTVAQRQAELMLARMIREVRQAQYISDSSTGADTTPVNVTYGGGTSSVNFYLPNVGSTSAGTQVTWTCSAGGSCTRAAGGTTVTELTGVVSATFTPIGSSGTLLVSGAGALSAPSYPASIDFTLSVQVTSQLDRGQTLSTVGVANPIILQDGTALRSYSS
jgi:prepilin-type N-terminal cleavage/methylation domain-containing protein